MPFNSSLFNSDSHLFFPGFPWPAQAHLPASAPANPAMPPRPAWPLVHADSPRPPPTPLYWPQQHPTAVQPNPSPRPTYNAASPLGTDAIQGVNVPQAANAPHGVNGPLGANVPPPSQPEALRCPSPIPDTPIRQEEGLQNLRLEPMSPDFPRTTWAKQPSAKQPSVKPLDRQPAVTPNCSTPPADAKSFPDEHRPPALLLAANRSSAKQPSPGVSAAKRVGETTVPVYSVDQATASPLLASMRADLHAMFEDGTPPATLQRLPVSGVYSSDLHGPEKLLLDLLARNEASKEGVLAASTDRGTEAVGHEEEAFPSRAVEVAGLEPGSAKSREGAPLHLGSLLPRHEKGSKEGRETVGKDPEESALREQEAKGREPEKGDIGGEIGGKKREMEEAECRGKIEEELEGKGAKEKVSEEWGLAEGKLQGREPGGEGSESRELVGTESTRKNSEERPAGERQARQESQGPAGENSDQPGGDRVPRPALQLEGAPSFQAEDTPTPASSLTGGFTSPPRRGVRIAPPFYPGQKKKARLKWRTLVTVWAREDASNRKEKQANFKTLAESGKKARVRKGFAEASSGGEERAGSGAQLDERDVRFGVGGSGQARESSLFLEHNFQWVPPKRKAAAAAEQLFKPSVQQRKVRVPSAEPPEKKTAGKSLSPLAVAFSSKGRKGRGKLQLEELDFENAVSAVSGMPDSPLSWECSVCASTISKGWRKSVQRLCAKCGELFLESSERPDAWQKHLEQHKYREGKGSWVKRVAGFEWVPGKAAVRQRSADRGPESYVKQLAVGDLAQLESTEAAQSVLVAKVAAPVQNGVPSAPQCEKAISRGEAPHGENAPQCERAPRCDKVDDAKTAGAGEGLLKRPPGPVSDMDVDVGGAIEESEHSPVSTVEGRDRGPGEGMENTPKGGQVQEDADRPPFVSWLDDMLREGGGPSNEDGEKRGDWEMEENVRRPPIVPPLDVGQGPQALLRDGAQDNAAEPRPSSEEILVSPLPEAVGKGAKVEESLVCPTRTGLEEILLSPLPEVVSKQQREGSREPTRGVPGFSGQGREKEEDGRRKDEAGRQKDEDARQKAIAGREKEEDGRQKEEAAEERAGVGEALKESNGLLRLRRTQSVGDLSAEVGGAEPTQPAISKRRGSKKVQATPSELCAAAYTFEAKADPLIRCALCRLGSSLDW
jgi:hypothetical protein